MDFRQHLFQAFEKFESQLNGERASAIHQSRRSAILQLETLTFPTRKNEAWKYTDLSPLFSEFFNPVTQVPDKIENWQKLEIPYLKKPKIILQNGFLIYHDPLPMGITIQSFDAVASDENQNHALFSTPIVKNEYIFDFINLAFAAGGYVLSAEKDVVSEIPIVIIHHQVATADKPLIQPRLIINIADGAQITIIEHFIGTGKQPALINDQQDVKVGKNASLVHKQLVENTPEAWHIHNQSVSVQQDGRYTSHFFGLTGKMTRNQLKASIEGMGAEVRLNGLYVGSGNSHIDNQTVIDHQVSNGTSHELYKGILADESTGIFDGRIIVREEAQKTYSDQQNRNLLLSDLAKADSKPQLEIYADDVKCYHGATVGQLDEEQIFYLRSRGIGSELAKAILTHAFGFELLEYVKEDALREYIDNRLLSIIHSPVKAEDMMEALD